jgi:hypothetical protein
VVRDIESLVTYLRHSCNVSVSLNIVEILCREFLELKVLL